MASEKSQHKVDNHRTCSVCLEPFRGRAPKLLSCFHTFCSPCLAQLAEKERGTGSRVTLTCPTCRTCIPVPPGGVKKLQSNFYLAEAAEEGVGNPQPPNCDLCEEAQKAEFRCANCGNNFCSRCRRSHDKLCQSPAAASITPDRDGRARPQSAGGQGRRDTRQMLENVLKKAALEGKKLSQERKDTERRINHRYTSLLAFATEARDTSLRSLREATNVVSEALVKTASLAREALKGAGDTTAGLDSRGYLSDDVLAESTRRRFEEVLQKADDEPVLRYDIADGSEHALLQSLSDFMSTVVVVVVANRGDENSSGADEDDDRQLYGPSQDTAASAQQKTGLLNKAASAVQDKDEGGSADVTALQKEIASLREELTSQRRELVSFKDKSSLAWQENQNLRSDVSSLQTDHKKLQSDHNQLHTECNQLKADLTQLRSDHNQVDTSKTQLQSPHDQLRTDCSQLKAGLTQLGSDRDQLQTDLTQLKSDRDQLRMVLTQLRTDRDQLQTDLTQLKSDRDQLRMDLTQLRSDRDQLRMDLTQLRTDRDQAATRQPTVKGDRDQGQSKVQVDQDTVVSHVQTLTATVAQLEGLWKKDRLALAALETRMSKLNNVRVAFHAFLSDTLIATHAQTVICDFVFTNVGDAYSPLTGVFTAPVSGIYCFLATSGPSSKEASKRAALHITLGEEEEDVAYLGAVGRGMATAHCAVHVPAGGRVKLRSFHGHSEEITLCRAFFTGVLVQADGVEEE